MKKLTTEIINNAMFSCVEGYVRAIIDSIEFELGSEITIEEGQLVYEYVEQKIRDATKDDE